MSNNKLKTNDGFYSQLNIMNNYSLETRNCIENTVKNLTKGKTTANNPGMLLGEIQSGKTRTFIGTIALAFDNNYDMAIVLTKGTKALAKQTYSRLTKDFSSFIEQDTLQIFDVMTLPDNLTNFELEQKTILVVKKEKNNLIRLENALFRKYPFLATKKVLIVDDEADFASIGFVKAKKEAVNLRAIAKKIDDIRQKLKRSDFLQVTATPYALYLQPKNIKINDFVFKPLKPSFTEIVPLSEGYIGGDYYFNKSQDQSSLAYYLYEPIPLEELELLKSHDRSQFKIENILVDQRVETLRNAIMNFIVGGVIRRLQAKKAKIMLEKYSFIIHTEQKKLAHEWQKNLITEIKKQFYNIAKGNQNIFTTLIEKSYTNLKSSLSKTDSFIPEFEEVRNEVEHSILKDHIMITTVNSEKDVNELLDDTGQLRLRVPLNIFIGGQILDRGITVKNLIGFYYGRNPKKFQQDTVLQHSRMYGYRPTKDLAVTRFYTTNGIYEVMNKIYELDNTLRSSIKNGKSNNGVIFIQKDVSNKIVPCSPNKIIIPEVTILKPFKRLLPIGFQTKSHLAISKTVKEIDSIVDSVTNGNEPALIDIKDAKKIIENIYKTFSKNKKIGELWDVDAFISCMEYLACNIHNKNIRKVWLITRKGRNIARFRKGTGRYEDAPDTASGENNELNVAKRVAIENPVLILTRQQGLKEEKGWNDAEFWWPVLVTPGKTPTVIYTSETLD
ncbi:Z1 domain-containing protein [Oceanobacillus massiliensis]|uniref:Z1 domain-containing protein n=1 Tax=Oceanobacillus massiliensis TaxID=1465765 RepID=UPI00301AD7FE